LHARVANGGRRTMNGGGAGAPGAGPARPAGRCGTVPFARSLAFPGAPADSLAQAAEAAAARAP
jgi:hypothetical protein